MPVTGSVAPACPQCGRAIVSGDINVANDVAYCRACNLAHRLSALVEDASVGAGVDFNRPPEGVAVSSSGRSLLVRATHRSIGMALGSLGVALFWNGIVSIFVLVAIAGTLHNLHVRLPRWFPAPDMNESPMSPGMNVFLWLFLTPFIAIGLGMLGAFLMSLAGRTDVRIDHDAGEVFTGIGPLGYRRRFSATAVSHVRVEDRHWRDNDGDYRNKTAIVIETREGKRIRFGTLLTDERRKFVAAVIRKALLGPTRA